MSCFKSYSLVNRALFPAPAPSYNITSFRRGTVSSSTLLLLPIAGRSSKFPALFIEPAHPKGGLLMYFHGNGADLGLVHTLLIRLALELDVHVLAVEYPGYGVCPDYGHRAPSEAAIDTFAMSAWNFAIQQLRFDPSDIIIFGRSIGTGPAAKLASVACTQKQNPAALILQSPYTSVKGLVRGFGGIMKFGSNFLLQRWNTQKNIKDMRAPVLILHGDQDALIPLSNGQAIATSRLKSSLPAWCATELFVQKRATHNAFSETNHVVRPIQRFLVRCRAQTETAETSAADISATSAAVSASELDRTTGLDDEISQFDLTSRNQHVRSQVELFSLLRDPRTNDRSRSANKSPMWKIGLSIFGASMAASEASAGALQSSVRRVRSAQEQVEANSEL